MVGPLPAIEPFTTGVYAMVIDGDPEPGRLAIAKSRVGRIAPPIEGSDAHLLLPLDGSSSIRLVNGSAALVIGLVQASAAVP